MHENPVFVDLHGLGPAPDPGPVWKRCWQGKEPLWRVFWGWFVCGHGAILGSTMGAMVLAMLFGLMIDTQTLNAGVTGMAIGATVLALMTVPYLLWALVSLWRCAYNCLNYRWGHLARFLVIVYAMLLLAFLNFIFM